MSTLIDAFLRELRARHGASEQQIAAATSVSEARGRLLWTCIVDAGAAPGDVLAALAAAAAMPIADAAVLARAARERDAAALDAIDARRHLLVPLKPLGSVRDVLCADPSGALPPALAGSRRWLASELDILRLLGDDGDLAEPVNAIELAEPVTRTSMPSAALLAQARGNGAPDLDSPTLDLPIVVCDVPAPISAVMQRLSPPDATDATPVAPASARATAQAEPAPTELMLAHDGLQLQDGRPARAPFSPPPSPPSPSPPSPRSPPPPSPPLPSLPSPSLLSSQSSPSSGTPPAAISNWRSPPMTPTTSPQRPGVRPSAADIRGAAPGVQVSLDPAEPSGATARPPSVVPSLKAADSGKVPLSPRAEGPSAAVAPPSEGAAARAPAAATPEQQRAPAVELENSGKVARKPPPRPAPRTISALPRPAPRSNFGLWMAAVCAAAALLIVVVASRNRASRQEQHELDPARDLAAAEAALGSGDAERAVQLATPIIANREGEPRLSALWLRSRALRAQGKDQAMRADLARLVDEAPPDDPRLPQVHAIIDKTAPR